MKLSDVLKRIEELDLDDFGEFCDILGVLESGVNIDKKNYILTFKQFKMISPFFSVNLSSFRFTFNVTLFSDYYELYKHILFMKRGEKITKEEKERMETAFKNIDLQKLEFDSCEYMRYRKFIKLLDQKKLDFKRVPLQVLLFSKPKIYEYLLQKHPNIFPEEAYPEILKESTSHGLEVFFKNESFDQYLQNLDYRQFITDWKQIRDWKIKIRDLYDHGIRVVKTEEDLENLSTKTLEQICPQILSNYTREELQKLGKFLIVKILYYSISQVALESSLVKEGLIRSDLVEKYNEILDLAEDLTPDFLISFLNDEYCEDVDLKILKKIRSKISMETPKLVNRLTCNVHEEGLEIAKQII